MARSKVLVTAIRESLKCDDDECPSDAIYVVRKAGATENVCRAPIFRPDTLAVCQRHKQLAIDVIEMSM